MTISEFTVERYRAAIEVLTPLYAMTRDKPVLPDEDAMDLAVINAMHDDNMPGVMVAIEEWQTAWEKALSKTEIEAHDE